MAKIGLIKGKFAAAKIESARWGFTLLGELRIDAIKDRATIRRFFDDAKPMQDTQITRYLND